VSYGVTGRYQEIGIRMAPGATARNVLGKVLRQTMRPVVVGAVIALARRGTVNYGTVITRGATARGPKCCAVADGRA
jgi:hypothetical protein